MTSDEPAECECRDYGRDSSQCRLHWYRDLDVRRAAEMAADIVMKRIEAAGKAEPKRNRPKDEQKVSRYRA